LRAAKELGQAIAERKGLTHLIIYDMKRSAGWPLIKQIVELEASIRSLTLSRLDIPEGWATSQFGSSMIGTKIEEFRIVDSKTTKDLKGADLNPVYDSIATALNTNTTIKRVSFNNIVGALNGDISRFIDKISRNKTIDTLQIRLDDIWDRLRAKSLADYILFNTSLKILDVSGCQSSIFDYISDSLAKSTIKTFVCTPLEFSIEGKKFYHGMYIDGNTETKLRKIIEKNPGLTIIGMREETKELVGLSK